MVDSEPTLQFIESLDVDDDPGRLVGSFRVALEQLGVPYFFCLKQNHSTLRLTSLAQAWPQGWHSRYDKQEYASSDPVLHAVLRDTGPVIWHEAPVPNDPLPKRVMNEACSFGLSDGIAFAIRGSPSSSLYISLAAGSRLDCRQAGLAHFASMYFAIKLERLLSPSARHCAHLTRRERDCLSWTARGKTDWELSCILGISQHTVTQHIKSATRKLNASNRTHAVAVAILHHELVL